MADRTVTVSACSVPNCSNPATWKGYCQTHRSRIKKYGDPQADRPIQHRQSLICIVEGCDQPAFGRSMCPKHYTRWRRHGDPLTRRSKPTISEFRCAVNTDGVDKGCDKQAKYMSELGPMCAAHYQRFKKYGDPLAGRAPHGTGSISPKGYRMIGKRLEHRVVMERILGRPLDSDETVHHINGDRTDNRPENLQLWIKKAHVPGQSVEDQVRWAREVLAKYEPILDRLPARGHR